VKPTLPLVSNVAPPLTVTRLELEMLALLIRASVPAATVVPPE
jgi:hypothetical protein